MAYEIGTVSTAAALRLVIENFAVANGFTLNAGAGSWLSKGLTHVRLTTSTITGASSVIISAANSADGLTELCPYTRRMVIIDEDWPVEYQLFYSPTPDQVTCVVTHATTNIQTLIFGDIVKIHTDAYVGGNWFYAPYSVDTLSALSRWLYTYSDNSIETRTSASGVRQSSPIPFAPLTTAAGSTNNDSGVPIHVKIDGRTWGTNIDTPNIKWLASTNSLLFRSPNGWNSQANLVTLGLQIDMASSLKGYLGYIEHLRLIRTNYYQLGDIITLGPDQWKVFPWVFKNSALPNGGGSAGGSGTIGFAVRYVV